MKRICIFSVAASRIRLLASLLALPALAACGTFQLASGVYPVTAKTSEQQQLDNLSCKDRARLEANTAERQAGAFALGFTIIGAPLAYELEKKKQREVYKSCMEAKGYRVLPPNDDPQGVATVHTPSDAAASKSIPPDTSSRLESRRDESARLRRLQELRDNGLITEVEYEAKRKEILFSL